MKTEKWIFIGKDGSLGFRNGQTYSIYLNVWRTPYIKYKTSEGEVECPYDSWRAFFKNWKLKE